MTEYDNTNTGTLFKNDMDGKSENFPSYGGSTEQECPHCKKTFFTWVSAWLKDGKKDKFFKFKFKPKDAKPDTDRTQEAPKQAPKQDDPFDSDSIPF